MGFLVTLQKAGLLGQVVGALKAGANSVEFMRNYLEVLDSFNPKKKSDFLSRVQEIYFNHADKFTANAVLSMSNILAITLKADYALGTGTAEESSAILDEVFGQEKAKIEVALVPEIAYIPVQESAPKEETVIAPSLLEPTMQLISEEQAIAVASLTEKQDELTEAEVVIVEQEVAKMAIESTMEVAQMAQQDLQDQAIQETQELIAYGNEVADKLQSLETTKKELDNSSAHVVDCKSEDKAKATAEKIAAFIFTAEAMIKQTDILNVIGNAIVGFGINYSDILEKMRGNK